MNLDALGEALLTRLEAKHERREQVLGHSRRVVRHAARAIRAVHRRDWAEADEILVAADEIVAQMRAAAEGHPDIESAGYRLDAEKEVAEAYLTRDLVRSVIDGQDRALRGPEDLGVPDAAWLNGLGEAAGELRRAALDLMRVGEVALAERALERMQEIHVFLSSIDLPHAITGNVKRTNDMVRGVTERTRGDLTTAARQEALQAALVRLEARFGYDGNNDNDEDTNDDNDNDLHPDPQPRGGD
jgi:translin